jgi:hypothetical protein
MKRAFGPLIALIVLADFTACVAPHSSPVVRGRRQGGVAGAAVGGAINGWEGAAAGALIGGTVGGMTGRARRSYYTGTPYWTPARSYRGRGFY